MIQIIRQIVEAKWFHHGIVAVIVLAGIVAGLETSPELMLRHGPAFHALDALILGIFIVEALLKMAAHGRRPWRYFADGWNVFDLLEQQLAALKEQVAKLKRRLEQEPGSPGKAHFQ